MPTKRSFSNISNDSSDMNIFTPACTSLPGGPPIGLDPTYIPQRRRRVASKSLVSSCYSFIPTLFYHRAKRLGQISFM